MLSRTDYVLVASGIEATQCEVCSIGKGCSNYRVKETVVYCSFYKSKAVERLILVK